MDADLDVIKQRLYDGALSGEVRDVHSLLDGLGPQGVWSDVDYDQLPEGWYWASIEHLFRMEAMARAYRWRGHTMYGDVALRRCILAAYDAWCSELRGEGAGWHVINTRIPRSLGATMVLMEADLSEAQKAAGYAQVIRGWEGRAGWNGENLVWRARGTLGYVVMKPDPGLLEEIVERVGREAIAVADLGAEGIQADFSFHHHKSLLYNGGYGLHFVMDTARFARLLAGTRYAFSNAQIGLISSTILDGSQWMVRGRVLDYQAMGRFITRTEAHETARSLVETCHVMDEVDPSRAEAFRAFGEHIMGNSGAAVEGNRHFWRSDFMAHQRQDYYASVRMCSTRTVGSERCTGEGLQSYHFADGMTTVIRHGKEFGGDGQSIFPVWNWRQLPGTTCEQSTAPLPSDRKSPGNRQYWGVTSFAGGVSDGRYGAAGFDFLKYVDPDDTTTPAVRARKGVFFFDDEFVCLGAGIRGFRDYPIHTGVNQCLLKGPVTVHSGGGIQTCGAGEALDVQTPGWALHDGVGYLFPETASVTLQTAARRGPIRFVTRETLGHTRDVYEAEVFSLFVDHGIKPEGVSYAYLVVPGTDAEGLRRYEARSPVRVVENSERVQAVRHDGLGVSGIVFYTPGQVQLQPDLCIRVDVPCIVLVCEGGTGAEVSVANPEGVALAVEVAINDAVAAFELPGGRDGGKSVTQRVAF